jgi:hypothetical protein
MSAKLVSDGVFPPGPRSVITAISDANVPVLCCVSEQSSQPANDHMIQHAVIWNKYIYIFEPEFLIVGEFT